MSLPNSRFAYTDCYAVLDAALEDPAGCRTKTASHDAALTLLARLHYARKLKRLDSEQVYELGDPKYGVSPYDTLVCRIKNLQGTFYVYIEHRPKIEVENLSEVEDGQDNHPNLDRRDLVDDLAASSIGGDRDQGGNGGATGPDERPVHQPKIDRRL